MAKLAPEQLSRVLDLHLHTEREGSPYYHWDELRHRTPPTGYSHEEWWHGLKLARAMSLRRLPLEDSEVHPQWARHPARTRLEGRSGGQRRHRALGGCERP